MGYRIRQISGEDELPLTPAARSSIIYLLLAADAVVEGWVPQRAWEWDPAAVMNDRALRGRVHIGQILPEAGWVITPAQCRTVAERLTCLLDALPPGSLAHLKDAKDVLACASAHGAGTTCLDDLRQVADRARGGLGSPDLATLIAAFLEFVRAAAPGTGMVVGADRFYWVDDPKTTRRPWYQWRADCPFLKVDLADGAVMVTSGAPPEKGSALSVLGGRTDPGLCLACARSRPVSDDEWDVPRAAADCAACACPQVWHRPERRNVFDRGCGMGWSICDHEATGEVIGCYVLHCPCMGYRPRLLTPGTPAATAEPKADPR